MFIVLKDKKSVLRMIKNGFEEIKKCNVETVEVRSETYTVRLSNSPYLDLKQHFIFYTDKYTVELITDLKNVNINYLNGKKTALLIKIKKTKIWLEYPNRNTYKMIKNGILSKKIGIEGILLRIPLKYGILEIDDYSVEYKTDNIKLSIGKSTIKHIDKNRCRQLILTIE